MCFHPSVKLRLLEQNLITFSKMRDLTQTCFKVPDGQTGVFRCPPLIHVAVTIKAEQHFLDADHRLFVK